EVLSGDEARAVEPALSEAIGAAVVLRDQRFIDPGQYVHALADAVVDRGGEIRDDAEVVDIDDSGLGPTLVLRDGERTESFDAVVVATGAWLGRLGREFGVRRVVQAGRGYSFSVPIEHLPNGPVYFPAARVACTPVGGRLRVAG